MKINRTLVWTIAVAALALAAYASLATAANTKSIALLSIHLQNDNEMYEPTTDAERARLKKVANSRSSR